MPNAIMIFAAGFGTRMGALTSDRPKPLIPVAGRPLIDHAIALATDAGIGKIVANVHYLPDQLITHLAPHGIAISDERDEILETGGGFKKALPMLGGGAVITLNSDAVWTGSNPITRLKAAWDPERMDALMALVPRENAIGYTRNGDFTLDEAGRLTPGEGLVYTGCQIIKTDLFAHHNKTCFSMWDIWQQILAQRRMFGILHDGHWCDVGHPDGIKLAENLFETDV
ncbi:nucleotidyltransferase family protein [Aliiroseovarius lamellibrachiae]|uniref:nucleotidyltransferase family protein n=1 Tax=Aliiroseovarius lamellibrachiae TaxID=1924933 RepID=UPI001BE0DAC1|nr:nucleotidyltransferase family protein [Aliiroseovarius lamellibrachiae]MBT2131865.1 nucleotidyltransferase family protein [Aliiroseovarius lamellibrachiae]